MTDEQLPPWLRLRAGYHEGDEFLDLSPLGELLYVRALSHCKIHSPEGTITEKTVRRLTMDMGVNASALVDELVTEGLWTLAEDGYRIRQWSKWQTDRAQRDGRKGGLRSAHIRGFHKDKPNPGCPMCIEESTESGVPPFEPPSEGVEAPSKGSRTDETRRDETRPSLSTDSEPPPSPAADSRESLEEALFAACWPNLAGQRWRDVLGRTDQSRLQTAARDLAAIAVSPDEVHRRADRARAQWTDGLVTPRAIEGNWSALAGDGPVATEPVRATSSADRQALEDRYAAELANFDWEADE